MPIIHKHPAQQASTEYPELGRWLAENMGLTVSADGEWSFRDTTVRKSLDNFPMLTELREKIGFDHICVVPTDPLTIVVDSKPAPTAFTTSAKFMGFGGATSIVALALHAICAGHGQQAHIRTYHDAAFVSL